MKVRMFTVLAMIFFYRLLKKSDLILIEMKEIILKIKDTAFSDTPYLAGQFIGAVFLFAIYILVLISILSMIIEIEVFEEV